MIKDILIVSQVTFSDKIRYIFWVNFFFPLNKKIIISFIDMRKKTRYIGWEVIQPYD